MSHFLLCSFLDSYYNDSTGSSSVTFDLTLQDWPKIPPSSLPQTMVQELGPGFFFAACMVLFINVLNTIVGEKELHLRRGMEMMGLKVSKTLNLFSRFFILPFALELSLLDFHLYLFPLFGNFVFTGHSRFWFHLRF